MLGSGKTGEAAEIVSPAVSKLAPAWRFHKDFPEGRLVKTDEELAKLDAEDWKDHPGKVRLLPGHEKVWEEEGGEVDWSSLDKSPDKES